MLKSSWRYRVRWRICRSRFLETKRGLWRERCQKRYQLRLLVQLIRRRVRLSLSHLRLWKSRRNLKSKKICVSGPTLSSISTMVWNFFTHQLVSLRRTLSQGNVINSKSLLSIKKIQSDYRVTTWTSSPTWIPQFSLKKYTLSMVVAAWTTNHSPAFKQRRTNTTLSS